jgi:hypothetical protein
MKLTDIGEEVARRRFVTSEGKEIVALIGKPQPFQPPPGYFCPFQIVGMYGDRVFYCGGEDAIQAIILALKLLGTRIVTSKEAKEGKLKWEAGTPADPFGLPTTD